MMISVLTACPPSPQIGIEKNGKVYGITKGLFRYNWWNYYERGCSFMDGEFYVEAERDFREALKECDVDHIRTRTYGFHFIDYFAHRELGISLFHQQKYQESIDELERSLSTERSSRGYYYLDKARKDLIVNNKSDNELPQIFIASPEPKLITNSTVIHVKGHVSDDTYVSKIWINTTPVRLDVSAKSIQFDESITLKSGDNHLVIKVLDIVGKPSIQKTKVICDLAGPVLNINNIESPKQNTYIVDGFAYDNGGIQEMRINGKNIIHHLMFQKSWKHQLITSENEVIITAIDTVGNKTTANINIALTNQSNTPQIFNRPLFASMEEFPVLPKINRKQLLDKKQSNMMMASNERGGSAGRQSNKSMSGAGNYFALIIGINAYEHWTPLKTAVHDATEFKHILTQKYAISNAELITDQTATLKNTVRMIRRMAGDLGENDNFLLYFAGHGQLDDLTSDGYWIPVDGLKDDPCTWITHSSIKSILSSEKVLGKNIMVIADSCYSGNLLRGSSRQSDTSSQKYEQRLFQLAQKKSRQIIASGGMEQVADWGRDNHSLFAYYLIQALRDNQEPVIDLENLILTKVWKNVSEKGGQRPTIGRLKTPMDEDGQFILVFKNKFPQQQLSAKTSIPPNFPNSYPTRSNDLPDTVPPKVTINVWKKERVVFLERVCIDGNALDEQGRIQTFEINNKRLINRPTKQVYFNTLEDLQPGINTFKIVCVDHVGNTTEKEIRIIRKVQKVFDIASRMSVILFPFELDETYPINMYDMILSRLLDSRRFSIIRLNRDRFIHKNADDQDKMLQTARDLKADMFFSPQLILKDNSIDLRFSATITNTNEIVSNVDVYGEQITRQLIELLSESLHLKILDEFPLVKGKLLKCNNKRAIINLGENYNIKKGMQVIFYKEDEPIIDPDTGENYGVDVTEISTLMINEVHSKMSYANLLKNSEPDALRRGVKLITK